MQDDTSVFTEQIDRGKTAQVVIIEDAVGERLSHKPSGGQIVLDAFPHGAVCIHVDGGYGERLAFNHIREAFVIANVTDKFLALPTKGVEEDQKRGFSGRDFRQVEPFSVACGKGKVDRGMSRLSRRDLLQQQKASLPPGGRESAGLQAKAEAGQVERIVEGIGGIVGEEFFTKIP